MTELELSEMLVAVEMAVLNRPDGSFRAVLKDSSMTLNTPTHSSVTPPIRSWHTKIPLLDTRGQVVDE